MPQPIIKNRNGYGPELNPLAGEAELDRLSGLWDLVRPFAYSGVVTIANGSTAAVIWSREGKGREGILVAYAFDVEAEDYTTTPVTIEHVDLAVDGTVQDVGAGNILPGGGRFTTPIGSLTQPFIMPFPIAMKADRQVAIVVKNASGIQVDAQAFVYGVTWSKDQNRSVRRALFGMRPADIWQAGLFTGGK